MKYGYIHMEDIETQQHDFSVSIYVAIDMEDIETW